MPATSTSALISSKPGFFISNHGFTISSENTKWEAVDRRRSPHIILEYRSPKSYKGVQPSFTVRVDESPNKTLKSYMKQSLSEYERFGFKTLEKKPLKINNQLAYLIDIYSSASQRKLRQIVFFKHQKAAILTCRSHMERFTQTVVECNQLFKNFTWN